MAAKKTANTPTAIANKVIEDLGDEILKIIKENVKRTVEFVMEDFADGPCWEEDLADSEMRWELYTLIGDYLDEHIVAETKLTLVE